MGGGGEVAFRNPAEIMCDPMRRGTSPRHRRALIEPLGADEALDPLRAGAAGRDASCRSARGSRWGSSSSAATVVARCASCLLALELRLHQSRLGPKPGDKSSARLSVSRLAISRVIHSCAFSAVGNPGTTFVPDLVRI
jgi:hypothetical protein